MNDQSEARNRSAWRGVFGHARYFVTIGAAFLVAVLTAPGGLTGSVVVHAAEEPHRGLAAPAPVAPTQGGFRTVVIDPGHGGNETGAISSGGLSEKELTLDISRRLSDLIVQRLGLDVRLTRDRDVYKDLEERTAFANNLKADVFISIHANAYRGRGVRGAETFFLSDRATDDAARRLAAIENDALQLREPASGNDGLQMLLWDMAQTAHLQESAVLAEMIQRQLNALGGTTDRGIKQAPFRVLKGANMPAVLVEVGFLSNPDEERMLADPGYRQRIANGIFESISEYRRRQAMLLGGGSNR